MNRQEEMKTCKPESTYLRKYSALLLRGRTLTMKEERERGKDKQLWSIIDG